MSLTPIHLRQNYRSRYRILATASFVNLYDQSSCNHIWVLDVRNAPFDNAGSSRSRKACKCQASFDGVRISISVFRISIMQIPVCSNVFKHTDLGKHPVSDPCCYSIVCSELPTKSTDIVLSSIGVSHIIAAETSSQQKHLKNNNKSTIRFQANLSVISTFFESVPNLFDSVPSNFQ